MKRPGATARHRLTLTSSVVGAVIVALDGSVLTVAQPTLRRDLGASLVQVQWTSTGYLIAVACLLVFAGRLGDRFGHRRVFAVGSLGFGVTSAGIGLAPGIGWVIGLRVAQGVFGALLQPATLGMLRAVYPPDRIGRPIALRTSAIGLAAAAGPVLGGALVGQFGWRAVFFLNVVPALALGGSALAVREPARSPGPTVRLDLPGACLLAVALACLVRTLVGVPGTGWTAESTAGLVVAVVVAAVFVRHERRTANPLLPPAVLGSTTVGAALGILVVASAAMFGTLFAGSCFLQEVLGLDPLQTGLRALPAAVMMVLGAPASAVLMRRFGARRTALAALCVLAAGVLLLSRLDRESTAVPISAGFLLLGAGFAGVMVTATTVVVRHVRAESAGVAGALQQTAMNVGPTLGVAAATVLMPLAGGVRTGPALTVLAAVAVAGLPLGLRLPGRDGAPTPRPDCPEANAGTPYGTMNTRQSTSRSAEENDGTPATRGRAA
ncbi:MFS transporter [Streptomyces sp. NPDC052287]|uniref:MFS transporter n=1 Tax=Streptomyces sp. NPDC052287 TaxID=3154950 RepID=UPI003441A188